MSDQALDLVFNALRQAQDNGVRSRASSAALARLAATAGSRPKSDGTTARAEAPALPKISLSSNPPSTRSEISTPQSSTLAPTRDPQNPKVDGSKAERL